LWIGATKSQTVEGHKNCKPRRIDKQERPQEPESKEMAARQYFWGAMPLVSVDKTMQTKMLR
jgi:hypothetical protein